jgi:uncharacterized protein (UPF0147 family)
MLEENRMEVTVGELKERLQDIFLNIVPKNVAQRCLKEMRRFKNNEEFEKARFEAKDMVSELLERICEMQNEPFHKLQTLVRKSPPNAQQFLIERFLFAGNILGKYDPETPISVPTDLAGLIRNFLIDGYNQKLQDDFPTL